MIHQLATPKLFSEMELFDKQSLQRAQKAFRCLPFNWNFYKEVQVHGLDAEQVFLQKELYQEAETKWFHSKSDVEDTFRWLITIGVLRREVDGQGLTSKIRLTPLGRVVLETAPKITSEKTGLREKLSHHFSRKWPLR